MSRNLRCNGGTMFFLKQRIKRAPNVDFVDAINRDIKEKLNNIGVEVINVKADINSGILNLQVCLNSEEIFCLETFFDK